MTVDQHVYSGSMKGLIQLLTDIEQLQTCELYTTLNFIIIEISIDVVCSFKPAALILDNICCCEAALRYSVPTASFQSNKRSSRKLMPDVISFRTAVYSRCNLL